MKTILDTSVLIGDSIDRIDGEMAISAISLAELHFGLLAAATPEQRALRLQRLVAALRASGRRPQARAFDLMIAATAHAHDARLLTRNAEDLRGIGDLVRIETVEDR